jgi:exosortase A-associated hydrolase 1
MRRMIDFSCAGDRLVGTLDDAVGATGLLIVSGGNEIRSGAYAGQAAMAEHFAAMGHPVFRYDRRGVGDSEGVNGGFESSADDIAAAVDAFRAEAPHLKKLVAFGNCDAATALALFHHGLAIDRLILANPWVIEAAPSQDDTPTTPSVAAIRARYWARLKNPRSLFDLLTGKIDLKKLAGGLAKASQKEATSGLAQRLAVALDATATPTQIIIAEHDTTALAFMGAWKGGMFDNARSKARFSAFGTASHSFADTAARQWLLGQIATALA